MQTRSILSIILSLLVCFIAVWVLGFEDIHAQAETVIPVPLYGVLQSTDADETYLTGAQIVNLGSETATVDIVFYDTAGNINSTTTVTVDAADSLTIFPLENPAGVDGAIELRSAQEVTAIFNSVTPNFETGGSYVAPASANEISLPLLFKGEFVSAFGIQNTNNEPANVSIAYSDGTSKNITLPAHTKQLIYQETETHTAATFAGTITSDVPVSTAVIQHNNSISFFYTGFTNASTTPVFPLVNIGTAVTGIQIQNAGGVSTEVTVSYTPSFAGTACTETQTITAGDSATFALLAFSEGSNSNCTGGARFVGSAAVTANSAEQPLVGIANQLLSASGESYTSFRVEDATDTVSLPLIMDRNGGFFTGFSVANVGDAETNINCAFTNSAYVVSGTVAAGSALTDIQFNKIEDGYVGSAICSGDVGSKIVAVVNQLGSDAGTDQFFVYEGINQ